MRRGFAVLVVAMVSLALAPMVGAQVTTGAIRGVVTDAQGAVLPGVTVTATSPTLVRGAVSVVSGPHGEFRLPGLQPGTYTLSAELSGFVATKIENLNVRLEQEVSVDVKMQLAGVSESVIVSAETQVVESDVVGLRERIAPATIDSIPLNGRQFLDLVTLVPGTATRPPDCTGRFGRHDSRRTFHQQRLPDRRHAEPRQPERQLQGVLRPGCHPGIQRQRGRVPARVRSRVRRRHQHLDEVGLQRFQRARVAVPGATTPSTRRTTRDSLRPNSIGWMPRSPWAARSPGTRRGSSTPSNTWTRNVERTWT